MTLSDYRDYDGNGELRRSPERIRLGRMADFVLPEARKGEVRQAEQRPDKEPLDQIEQNTSTTRFAHFGQTTAGTAAVQFGNFRAVHGVIFKADNQNTANVYIGNTPGVAVAGGRMLGGFELGPGDAVTLPIRELSDWWCIADADSQLIHLVGM